LVYHGIQDGKIGDRDMPNCFTSALLIVVLASSCQNKPQASPPDVQDAGPRAVQPEEGTPKAATAGEGDLDAIGKVEAFIKDSPVWTNGLSPEIHLPPSAKPGEVMDAYFKIASFDEGKVTSFEILATRTIATSSTQDDPYTAVSFTCDQGDWVMVMRHEGGAIGWWTKVFDPEELGPPSE
jgi:hypothetical protein